MKYLGEDNPQLLSFIKPQVLTLGEFTETAVAFTRELIALDPALQGLGMLIPTQRDGYPVVQPGAANLPGLLHEWAWQRRPAFPYVPLDAQGRPVATSLGTAGFGLTLTNGKSWDDKVDISLGSLGNGANYGNVANFVFSRVSDPQFRTDAGLARRLLATLVKHWPVQIASYGFDGVHKAVNWVGDNARGRRHLELNWWTYSDDPRVASGLPPDIEVQALGPGIVFRLTPEILSHHRPDHVALAERVRESLRAAGVLARVELPRIPLPVAQEA